nr:CpsD/CapB family tyrosine-protein kinase [Pseudalkalibacillus caeni]
MGRKDRKQLKKLNERSLITYKNPKSPIAEQFRTIRTNIQFASIDEEMKSIMVTSAGPGEGKSTTAANLAIVLTQQGKRVLLVDADMRKPTMHYTFQLTNIQGLTNVLTKQTNLANAISRTLVPDLDVLTSGPIPPNPSELLDSKAMRDLMKEAQSYYDVVLYDCPPVLAVTDAQIMANNTQGIVLVVRSGFTEKEAAQHAKERILKANGKLLGVVLNGKKMKEGQYYYYYANK